MRASSSGISVTVRVYPPAGRVSKKVRSFLFVFSFALEGMLFQSPLRIQIEVPVEVPSETDSFK